MNREIKFRALYDHMGGGWRCGMLIYEGDVPRIQQKGTMLFSTCLKGTEGQFTGLKDKNGKEIYEGDIVQSLDKANLRGKVVYYDNATAWWLIGEDFGLYLGGNWEPKFLEVLGNIYENSELLTQTNSIEQGTKS